MTGHPRRRASARTSGRCQQVEELIVLLEQHQLAVCKQFPVPRARLSSRVSAALWALRIFVIILSMMVLYSFFSQFPA